VQADTRLRHLAALVRVTADLKDLRMAGIPQLGMGQQGQGEGQLGMGQRGEEEGQPASMSSSDGSLAATPHRQAASRWIALGKHLCGAATDYAIRACISAERSAGLLPSSGAGDGQGGGGSSAASGASGSGRASPSPVAEGNAGASGSAAGDGAAAFRDGGGGGGGSGAGFRGLAIATCCHHRCGWRAYVNKPLMRQHGLGPQDFELVAWMTGAHG
jgi:tRNA:m4X modification enzyme